MGTRRVKEFQLTRGLIIEALAKLGEGTWCGSCPAGKTPEEIWENATFDDASWLSQKLREVDCPISHSGAKDVSLDRVLDTINERRDVPAELYSILGGMSESAQKEFVEAALQNDDVSELLSDEDYAEDDPAPVIKALRKYIAENMKEELKYHQA